MGSELSETSGAKTSSVLVGLWFSRKLTVPVLEAVSVESYAECGTTVHPA